MMEVKEVVRRALAEGVIPPGFLFVPKEKELLLYYLPRRASNSRLPNGFIVDFNIYERNPWDLPRDLFIYQWEQKEMYFFTTLRRIPSSCSKSKSIRYARTAGSGVWHGNGQDVTVKDDDGRVVGHSTSFTFMVFANNDDGDDEKKKKKKKQHVKTDWIMHEYRLQSTASTSSDVNADLVVCKIYEKSKRNESESHEGIVAPTLIPQGEEMPAQMAPTKRRKVDEHESMPSIDYHQHHLNSLDTESVPQDDGIATFVTQTTSSPPTFPTPTENQKTDTISNASSEPSSLSTTPHQLMSSSPNEDGLKIEIERPSPHEFNKLVSYGHKQGSLPPVNWIKLFCCKLHEMIADPTMLDSELDSPSEVAYRNLCNLWSY